MDYLPVFLKVKGRRAVITGGGQRAARKADLLLRAGCELTVVAPSLEAELAQLANEYDIDHRTGPVKAEYLAGCAVAVGAADDGDVNQQLYDLAVDQGIPVNIVDRPELCGFIMPAVVDRSPVLVAVSSGGAAPLLTRLLKARFETLVPAAYGRLAVFAGEYRDRVKALIPGAAARRRLWENLIGGPVAEYLFSGQEAAARALVEDMLEEAAGGGDGPPTGEVYLVGTGPGDPDLLTFRALRLMQQADVVLYDRLIGDGILNLVRRDAERIYVGKMPRDHTVAQEQIGELLLRLAREGKRVLRLKGGDPFVFGRGGEEIEALAAEGIAFQVIPGVTAACGCASYAGIPLTHRDHAQACVFVTGHGKDGTLDLNWDLLVQPRQTVVVYMGLASLATIAGELISHGAAARTPAAMIENGTRKGQRVIVGTLETLPELVAKAGVGGPVLIIIGSVVTLRERLSWYAEEEHMAETPGDGSKLPLPVISSGQVWKS